MFIYGESLDWHISNKHDAWGSFGDLLGGLLGPILSLIAFLGFLYSFNVQRQLALKQSFETNFYYQLQTHAAKASEIEIEFSDKRHKGIDAFRVLTTKFRTIMQDNLEAQCRIDLGEKATETNPQLFNIAEIALRKFHSTPFNQPILAMLNKSGICKAIKIALTSLPPAEGENFLKAIFVCMPDDDRRKIALLKYEELTVDLKLELFRTVYDDFYNLYGGQVGHYFRNMFHILSFLQDPNQPERAKFIQIYRSQLSRYEIAILFYNCLSSYSQSEFNDIVERHDFLKGVHYQDLALPMTKADIRALWVARKKIKDTADGVLQPPPTEEEFLRI
jgi:hypothetical protein